MRLRRSAVIATSLLVAAAAALAGELPQQPAVRDAAVAGPRVRPEVIVVPSLPRATHRVASAHESASQAPVAVRRVSVTPKARLPWLRGTQSALAIDGFGVVGTSGGGQPRPIASVTKVMTAYVVLHDHPLRGRSSGPIIIIGPTNMHRYEVDSANGGSTVPVKIGERITERQALEAMLLPSANNMAALLAAWDAGSVPKFVAKMNRTAQSLHLTRTHYVEPSGFDPHNVSTAMDQVHLAEMAMRVGTFASIVRERSAVIPVAGRVDNVNGVLGRDGFVGVKTGSHEAAGACYVFASVHMVGRHKVMFVGAILGYHPVQFSPEFRAARLLVAVASQVARPVTVRH